MVFPIVRIALSLVTLLSVLTGLGHAQPAPFARGARVQLTAPAAVLAYYGNAYAPYGYGTQPSGGGLGAGEDQECRGSLLDSLG